MKKLMIYALTLLTPVLSGCGSEPDTSRVTINIGGKNLAASSLPTLVYDIQFTISAPDMETIGRVVPAKNKTDITENFDVPLGRDRHFMVTALDYKSRPVYSGEEYVSLSGPPVTVHIVMTKTDKAIPTRPPGFSVSPYSHTRIDLSWGASSDDTGVEGYYVYRGGSLLATVPAYYLSYSDTGLWPSTEYCYSVSAFDRMGNESPPAANKCDFTKSVLTVWSWGDNSYGQLGDGSYNNYSPTPVEVVGLTGVNAVSAGGGYTGGHSLAIGPEPGRRVYAWGSNWYGQLGDQTYTDTDKSTPNLTSGFPSSSSEAISIAAGGNHSLAVTKDGWAYAWGRNDYGQLGCRTESNCPYDLSQVNWPQYVIPDSGGTWPSDSIFNSVAAGSNHSLALMINGTVWAWGDCSSGKLGIEPGSCELASGRYIKRGAIKVPGIANAVAIAAGAGHSLALISNGTVWAWGTNNWGQLGNGTTNDSSTPVQVSNITNATAIAAGANHNLALISNGTVWAWGYNNFGQLGDGTNQYKSTPVQVSSLANVTAIAAGERHSLARKSNGLDWTVWGWGFNDSGQLGNNDYGSSYMPVQVKGLKAGTWLTDAFDIKAGGLFSLAMILIDNQPPPIPRSHDTDNSPPFIWDAVEDDYELAEYRIYRSTNQVDWELVESVPESGLAIYTYTPGTGTYYYFVNAVDLRGNESAFFPLYVRSITVP